jgi:hypothetical protein
MSGPTSYVRLIARITSGQIPDVVDFLTTFSGLTPINKIPVDENEDRISRDLKPKYRPINTGVIITKQALDYLPDSPSGKRL